MAINISRTTSGANEDNSAVYSAEFFALNIYRFSDDPGVTILDDRITDNTAVVAARSEATKDPLYDMTFETTDGSLTVSWSGGTTMSVELILCNGAINESVYPVTGEHMRYVGDGYHKMQLANGWYNYILFPVSPADQLDVWVPIAASVGPLDHSASTMRVSEVLEGGALKSINLDITAANPPYVTAAMNGTATTFAVFELHNVKVTKNIRVDYIQQAAFTAAPADQVGSSDEDLPARGTLEEIAPTDNRLTAVVDGVTVTTRTTIRV